MKRALQALDHPVIIAALVLGSLSALWLGIGAPISLITQIAIYTLYGAGVNLLVGYTGLVPFGASVFFGVASYFCAIFLRSFNASALLGIIAATLGALLLGCAIGALILRRKGLYFSLLTLAFSQVAFEIANRWTSVTGGENGLQNVPRPLFPTDLRFHIFVVALVLACLWLLWRLAHARFGRVIQAVRDNEMRARSLGLNVYDVRLLAFTLMAGIIGLAGALLTEMLQGVYADNLSWQHAGDSLLMTVLGGVHQFLGPLWGAVAFIILEDRLSALTENWWLIFAPILGAFALLSPEGIQGLAQRLAGRARWTLTRATIPARPAIITPYVPEGLALVAGMPVLEARQVAKAFGPLVTARSINLKVEPCRLHALIGPNGAGKTTFFNMLAGVLPVDSGQILLEGRDVTVLPVHARARMGLARSYQILSIFPHLSVFENVRIGVQAAKRSIFGFFNDAHRDEAVNARAWSVLDAVGLADHAREPCLNLPHGAKRLLDIAMTLTSPSRLLLLDEPLAGLGESDRESVGRLIKKLATTHAVLLIEHDIDRVLALSDHISVLHQGRLIADGKPAEVAANPEVIAAYLGVNHGNVIAPVTGRANPGAPRLLQARSLLAGYGGSTVLSGIDLDLREGEALALLGRNGVGKTTLLRALTGTLSLGAGEVSLAGHVISGLKPFEINRAGMALVPEGRRIFPNLSVLDNLALATRPGGQTLDQIFALFPRLRERKHAKGENLSGGERQMVAIARALVAPSRLILFDEPFEGLAPAVVGEVRAALESLRGKVAMIIVEHHAETILGMVDRACVLVNGKIAFDGDAAALAGDRMLQARLLGVVEAGAERGAA